MAVDNNSNKTKGNGPREDPRVAALQQKRAQLAAKGGAGMSGESIQRFFKDTWSELKKTTWPDQQILTKSTLIVLAFIFAAALWEFVIGRLLDTATKPLFGI